MQFWHLIISHNGLDYSSATRGNLKAMNLLYICILSERFFSMLTFEVILNVLKIIYTLITGLLQWFLATNVKEENLEVLQKFYVLHKKI